MSDVREALRHTLQEALPDVVVLGSLLGTLADVPAVVVRRGSYPVAVHMGQDTPDTKWDLVLLVSSDDECRTDELDGLITNVLAVIEGNPDLGGAVAFAQAVEVGDEEMAEAGGQEFFSTTVSVEVSI